MFVLKVVFKFVFYLVNMKTEVSKENDHSKQSKRFSLSIWICSIKQNIKVDEKY